MNSVLFCLVAVALVSNMGTTLGQDPNSTTTAQPTTTTPKASTTTPKASTTTPKASTTTPKASTTTPKASTTTPKATTSAATTPAPKTNTFEVKENTTTCLKLQAKIEFVISYEKQTKTGKSNVTETISLPADATGSGKCGNETESLNITFYKEWSLAYTFTSEDAGKTYYVSALQLFYVLDDHFPNAADAGTNRTVDLKPSKSFMKANENGFTCSSKLELDNERVTVNTYDLKYRAFNVKGDISLKTSGALECSADEDTNSIVPIAVGAALAGLVVIVLIAYLIGRKRTRKTGYESV